jgi:hypothetical protein
MNKDVIYIDVDDDVTAVIGKIKQAKEKIVAIVPPKRAGALQSAVNLRLLDRMAKADKKQLVLITNNQALVGLAANASIPVAKNLQSKPELAEVPALVVDAGDDIIDGSELPVGDHAKTVKVKDGTRVPENARSEAIDAIDIDGEEVAAGAAATAAVARSAKPGAVKKPKNRPKIPNFDTFRKRLFLIIGGSVALVALLIWMFVFAPAATVIITASTSPSPVSTSVRLGGTAATNFQEGIVSSVSQSEERDATIEFPATGQRDVGERATGTASIRRLTQESYGVPAGTRLTSSNGTVFVTDTAVTIPASTPCFPSYCAQSVTVDVTAAESGTASNGISGNLTGPDNINGSMQGSTSGGTSRVARVVSAEDVERARGQVLGESTDEQKRALIAKFTNDEKVIDSSFAVQRGEETVTPAVGQEIASGNARLTIKTTYTIQAITKAGLESYLKDYLDDQLEDNQRVYSDGADEATLTNFRTQGDSTLVTINTTGSVGPEINEEQIKEQVRGKIYGEVQQELQAEDGIQEVDVQFSYFWVRTVPNDINRITIEFQVDTNE